MLFLCVMVSTLTVYADDRDFDSGGGITFKGSADTEPTPTAAPSGTGKQSGTTPGRNPSLPQTGQEAAAVLPTAGCAILFFTGWLVVVKRRRNEPARIKIRKENVLPEQIIAHNGTVCK